MAVVTIADARERGLKWYFTGEPCPRGHVAKRSLSNRTCRQCDRDRRAAKDRADPARVKARNIRRYHKNPVASREKVRAAYQRHVEARREYDRKRYHENPERKAVTFAKAARWWRENRGKKNEMTMRRRVWIKRATPPWLTEDDRAAIREIYKLAASFGPGVMEVDHIVPLRGRTVCGLHVPGNLRIVPAAVNRKKGNRHAE